MFRTLPQRIKTDSSYFFKTDILYGPNTYSQDGEDLIIKNLLHKKKGFYVDIGAHHPYRYSNTYLLYKSGWHGINIEPTPKSKKLFDRLRDRDINLQVAAGKKSNLKLYIFYDSALNTFSIKRMNEIVKSGQSKLKKTQFIEVIPLETILTKYANKRIDLLNIDTEGMELEILKTNNWKQFSPQVLAVEYTNNEKIQDYLINKNYNFVAKTRLTEIYIHD